MTKKSKKQRNKATQTVNDATGFSKTDWYGAGRRGRKQKKNKTKQPKNND